MPTSPGVRCRGPLLILLLILAAPALAPAQSQWQRLPPEMRTAMERNAAAISPISLTMIRTPSAPRSQEETATLIGLSRRPGPLFQSTRTAIIWQGRNFYSHQITEPSTQGPYITATNGQVLYSLQDENLLRTRPRTLPGTYGAFGASYLPEIGISVSGPPYEPQIQPRIQYLLETGAELRGIHSVADGDRTLPVITLLIANPTHVRAQQTTPEALAAELRRGIMTEEQIAREVQSLLRKRSLPSLIEYQFTLDPQFGYAIRRLDERYPDGSLIRRTQSTEFIRLDARDVWIPRRVRTDRFAFPETTSEIFDHAIYSTTMEIDGDLSLDPVPEDIFAITDVKAGTHIWDDLSAASHQVQFVVEPGMESAVREFLAGRGTRPIPSREELPADQPAEPGAGATAESGTESTGAAAAQHPLPISPTTNSPAPARGSSGLLAVVAVAAVALVGFVLYRRLR